jgi:hypothetical protein
MASCFVTQRELYLTVVVVVVVVVLLLLLLLLLQFLFLTNEADVVTCGQIKMPSWFENSYIKLVVTKRYTR